MGKQERQARRQARRQRKDERHKQRNIKRCRRNKGRCSNEVRDKLGIEHYRSPAEVYARNQLKTSLHKVAQTWKAYKGNKASQKVNKGEKRGNPKEIKGEKKM